MKRVSKMLVLLLTLVMVLSICGCGGSDGGKDLVGTWALKYDLADFLAGEMGEDFADFNAPLEMTICFQFTEDGKFTMFGEEASFKANLSAWLDELVTFGADVMYQAFEDQGLSNEEADVLFEETYGCSIPDYLRDAFLEVVDVDAMLKEMSVSGTYETKGDKLYMAQDGESIDRNAYDVFTVNGNTLKLELPKGADPSQGDILPGLSYPLEFTKKN